MTALPRRKHLLLLTMPAFGHMIPILELGKKLTVEHDVTLAITSDKAHELRKREILSPEDYVQVYAIQDGYRESDHVNLLTHSAFTAMMTTCLSGIERLVDSLPALDLEGNVVGDRWACGLKPVHVVMVDNFMASAVAKCREKNIPFYHFNAAATDAVKMWVMINENWPSIPDPPDRNAPSAMTYMIEPPQPNGPPPPLAEILKDALVKAKPTYAYAAGIIANSIREIEADAIKFLNDHPVSEHLEVFAVGPLMPEEKNTGRAKVVTDWLDRQAKNSVIYVSFGSVAWTENDQTLELYRALKGLNKPFIWSLPLEQQRCLPEEATKNSSGEPEDSFLILAWAPQKHILNHPATAVFLSHCGWNSTLETLTGGVPVVAWPMFADQLLNARFLEKMGVAVAVEDTGMQGNRVVSADEIKRLVNKVAGWGTTNEYGDAAREWKTKIAGALRPDGSSNKDLQKLMKF